MIEYKREYDSQEAEIRDSWYGTGIGFLCVLIIGLAVREFNFSAAYFGSSRLVRSSLVMGTGLAFATYLFLVKDAKGYEQLEKIRFILFSALFFVLFSFWFLPFTNRVFPALLTSTTVEAEIIKVKGGSRIGLGRKVPGKDDHTDLSLRIVTDKPEEAATATESEAAKKTSELRHDAPVVRLYDYDEKQYPVGSTITVQLYRGRWGQDFILPIE